MANQEEAVLATMEEDSVLHSLISEQTEIYSPAALKKEKLWTRSFLLLWQGQFVSVLGDIIYSMALGFWILAVTGSTALMGALMAVSILPGVIISPFAGALVDRSNRKRLLVLMDFIRGAIIVFIAIAAFNGFLKIWMVFGGGVILSICGAFFNPAVNSSIPDIVPRSKMISANSIFDMIYSGSEILGSAVGGILFQLLGAPFMFLFNGLSFIFSGSSISFMKIPKIENPVEKQHILKDMAEGFKFILNFRGLRDSILLASSVNFFTYVAIVLFLPLFQRTESLGAARYGIAMAIYTGGMLLGMLFTSMAKIPPVKRFSIFMFSALASNACFAVFSLFAYFPLMLGFMFAGNFLNAIINVYFRTSVQMTVPQNMRGKVFSIIGMLLNGVAPFAMALGGVLAEFIPIKAVIFMCFAITILLCIPFAFFPKVIRFINFNPETETLEDIL